MANISHDDAVFWSYVHPEDRPDILRADDWGDEEEDEEEDEDGQNQVPADDQILSNLDNSVASDSESDEESSEVEEESSEVEENISSDDSD